MGPGPSPVEPRVYEALAKPVVGHLDPYLFEVVEEVQEFLREVFGTTNEFTLAVSGTGTSSMEAAVTNFVEAGSRVAVFDNGYFCGRLADIVRRQDAEAVCLEKPWGEVFDDGRPPALCNRARPSATQRMRSAPW